MSFRITRILRQELLLLRRIRMFNEFRIGNVARMRGRGGNSRLKNKLAAIDEYDFSPAPSEDTGMNEQFEHVENNENVASTAPKASQMFNTVLYKKLNYEKYGKVLEKISKHRKSRNQTAYTEDNSISLIAEVLLKDFLLENEEKVDGVLENKEKVDDVNENTKINCDENVAVPYPYSIHTQSNPAPIPLSTEKVAVLKGRLRKLASVHYEESTTDDARDLEDEDFDLENIRNRRYGTPSSNTPPSTIPCGGCGSFLHCQDTGLPGYLPSEVFIDAKTADLRGLICQRCHFLKDYNVALAVNVSPEEYSKLLAEIRHKIALVILIVDLLDFPSSIWPGLVDIIGRNRPICVVGNKVDLLPCDSPGYLERIRKSLIETLYEQMHKGANIKHVALVSAKTGYGIEELITKLQHSWGSKGDVYLVGCTNVGKSSLFNALIQSDFCKSQAIDIIQRSTVSPWPGTTLNLLKFPILTPTARRLFERTKRVVAERRAKAEEENLRRHLLSSTKDLTYATLISHVGFTFYQPDACIMSGIDPFAVNPSSSIEENQRRVFNPKNREFVDSKWCFDTPGSVQPDQIINLLTLDELKMTLPKEIIRPRTYIVKPNYSLLLAGLGRIDILSIERDVSARLTVFSSPNLPVSVIPISKADEFYKEHLGTEVLGVPFGDENRLKDFPPLVGKEITLKGIGWEESCADITLSSAGWVSVTAGYSKCTLVAYTPAGKGCFLRQPALLPFAVRLRGERLKYTPCYKNDRVPYLQTK